MLQFARSALTNRGLTTHWRFSRSVRSLLWSATGKEASNEEVAQIFTSPDFIKNMSRVLPGPDRVRVTSADVEAHLETTYPRTIYEALQSAAEKNTANRNICGWVDPQTKELRFLTYDRFFKEANLISMALRELGIQPKDFVAVNMTNSKEYLETMYGVTSMSMILQPIYPNLDARAIRSILRQGEAKIYLVDSELKARVVVDRVQQLPSVKTLVVGGGEPSKDLRVDARAANIQLLSMHDFMRLGENKRHKLILPKTSDTFSLVYTSGTTGDPKGAIVTHGRLLRVYHTISSLLKCVPRHPGDYTFCFLPTGHIYEMLFEMICLGDGGTAMFWRGNIKHMASDIRIIRPHTIPMVPRIMNRIHDEVHKHLERNVFKRAVFMYCYRKKKDLMLKGDHRYDTIYDKLAFRRIRNLLGGRVSLIVSASAPLSPKVMEFFKVACGCAIIEVYGSTETAIATASSPHDMTGGHVGGPMPSVEIKLVDVPELNYEAKNDVGEIYVRSPYTFKGYYKNEAATNETLRNGWIATGDVGRWTSEGKLQILDRRKDIFKLAQGEYITPEKVESIYERVHLIEDIYVDGRPDQSFCVAIAVPNQAQLVAWAEANGLTDEPEPVYVDLCADVRVRKAFLEELRDMGRLHGLNELQQIRNVYIEPVKFSVANGVLTSTFKVKRNFARKKYAQTIDELYREGSLVDVKEQE